MLQIGLSQNATVLLVIGLSALYLSPCCENDVITDI